MMDSSISRQIIRRLLILIFVSLFLLFINTDRQFTSSHHSSHLSKVLPVPRHSIRAAQPQDQVPAASSTTSTSITSTTSGASATPLTVVQLSPPVILNDTINSKAPCQTILMRNTFSDSFGKQFVGNYTPPACSTSSNKVIMKLSVQSRGEQFDRLAIMYLGDNEVFRTSTAEPTRNGIEWEYEKDMSAYMALWKTSQKLIFDLPNQTTSNLTGVYHTTLTATYLTIPSTQSANPNPRPADMIIPISSRMGNNASSPSAFSIPTTNATNTISFPRNAARAIFSLSSTGQGAEEFWWSNFLQSDTLTFGPGANTFGNSPFREVQVLIDGQMAGVQWPFPVIFTGGVAPGLWSPVVGIDAFDLKEYEIDITPWLPLLCDGNEHVFSMKVVGLEDDGKTEGVLSEKVDASWVVSGNIFVWLDSDGSITTGSEMNIDAKAPIISVSQSLTTNSTGANETLTYTTSIQRTLSISSVVKTQNGSQICTWTQTLSHTDQGQFLNFGNAQINQISTIGSDKSTGTNSYSYTYSYPLFSNTTASSDSPGNVTFLATIRRSKNIAITGVSVFPSPLEAFAIYPKSAAIVSSAVGSGITTTQNGTATLFQSSSAGISTSFGRTSQELRLGAMSKDGAMGMHPDAELYYRSIAAINGTVRSDARRLVGEKMGK